MKKMFILMSHTMTDNQKEDARERLGVEHFVKVDCDKWGQMPAAEGSIAPYLKKIVDFIEKEAAAGDILLVQGDFGATCAMVDWAFRNDLVPVYATTQRDAVETTKGEKVVVTRVFRHVRFRQYEKIV